MRVVLVADHHGQQLKARFTDLLRSAGHEVDDRGVHGDGVVDYPPLCADACRQVQSGAADRAVVIGGSGQGEAIACNKHRGIRAGLCQDVWSTTISRGNNDSNVLVLGAKVVAPELADEILTTWLSTPFKGAEHARRLAMIAQIEVGQAP